MGSSSDQDAEFVALLTEHQAAVRFYVASLLPGEPRAADVAQLANATIWKKRASFEIGTNFIAWAFSIARYEVLSFHKALTRDARLLFGDEIQNLIAEELPEHAEEMEAKLAALQGCLEKLKKKDHDLIQHRYFRRTPLKQYANEIGRSVGGMKVALHRIRNNLQKCIEQSLPSEEGGT